MFMLKLLLLMYKYKCSFLYLLHVYDNFYFSLNCYNYYCLLSYELMCYYEYNQCDLRSRIIWLKVEYVNRSEMGLSQ
jgi:hypothetical protein